MSIWDGRFSEKMNPDFEIFNRSFETDQRLVLEDIQGSLAYAKALQKIDILTMKEFDLPIGPEIIRSILPQEMISFLEIK